MRQLICQYRLFISLVFIVLLGACASNEPVSESSAVNNDVKEQQLIDEAAAAAQLARQEEMQAEAAAAAKVEAEVLRQQEITAEAKRKAEAEAKQQAELAKQRAAEAQRQREIAQLRAAEQAEAAAKQQARIEELRAKIAASNSAAVNLEEANVLLQDALVAAESLTNALGEEQQKYASVDPASGEKLEQSAAATLAELTAEMERLRIQAQTLIDEAK